MSVTIAEYLGKKIDGNTKIRPAKKGSLCPFMDAECSKVKEKYKPVCSVRKTNGDLWIVCKHRLCSTIKTTALTSYQKSILLSVAKTIWSPSIGSSNILIKREVRIPLTDSSGYNADYVMVCNDPKFEFSGPRKVVLEMQGGGETSNTGKITRLVKQWEDDPTHDIAILNQCLKGVGTIETNAWRRQQEQFIIKGNIANQTGGAIVFCIGKLLYDYLYQRIKEMNLKDLRKHNWTLALLCFNESENRKDDEVIFELDPSKQIFTNYISFVQHLINQGEPYPEMFTGKFENLVGDEVII